jgi:hypothetical protein
MQLLFKAQQEKHLGLIEEPTSEASSQWSDSQDGDCATEDTGSSNSGQGVEKTVDSTQGVGALSSREIAPVEPKGWYPTSVRSCHGG